MSTVITVENLGKKYTISHQQREEYSSLRDTLTNSLSSFGKRLAAPFKRPAPNSRAMAPEVEDFWALKDVSFEVKQGDRIGIIGRNGAGKSTLLKILSRITEPTTGSIRIKGRVASLLEVGTGFHPELTGRENIYLNGAILGMQRDEIRRKFDEIVDFAEIEKFLDTPVKRYSSGMYVRLAFAVAAHLEPDILIVDEVLAVGDAQFQKKCLGKMEDVGREGRTVLFVSHNLTALRALCDCGIVLTQGQLIFNSAVEKAIDSYITLTQPPVMETVDVTDFPRAGGSQRAIKEAWLESFDGSCTYHVKMGSSVRFCFRFNADKFLVDPQFGFGVNSRFGERLFTFGNYVIHNKIFNATCVGVAVCEIPILRLLPGLYTVSLGLGFKKNESIDYIEHAFTFEVIADDIFGTGENYQPSHGVVYLDGSIYVRK